MSEQEESGSSSLRIPLELNLEQARELGRGNTIRQLQRNY